MTPNLKPFQNLIRPDLAETKASANMEFNEQINSLIESGRNIAHFGFGQSPFPVPKCLVEALKESAHEHGYLPTAGTRELRKRISEFHQKYDNLELDPSGVIVGPGTKELMYLVMANFNGVVLVPTPAWPTYSSQCKLAGRPMVSLDTEQENMWKLTSKMVKDACENIQHKNKLLILTNPGNPSSMCYTEEELLLLSDVFREEGIIVLSDEIYGRLKYSNTHCSLAKFYPEGTILSSGFSKCLSAGGWRIGYLHFPEPLKSLFDAVRNSASHTYSCCPAPMQYAVEKCLRTSSLECEQYMKNCRKIMNAVGDYCHRELESVGVTGHRSEASYYFIPDFEVIRVGLSKRGINTGLEMTKAMLEEADVALMDSEVFMRPERELCVRFCFVCFDGGKTLEALSEMSEAEDLNDDFVKKFCPHLADGVQNLKKWVLKHV